MTDVIELLKTKAEAQGLRPIVADPTSIMYELQNAHIEDGATFIYFTLPTYTRGISSQTYNGDLTYSIEIMVGRKNEAETFSSIAETAAQKYDNRLFELQTTLNNFLNSFFCSNDLEELSTSVQIVKNVFSMNVDAVLANVTFRAWNQ